MVNDSIAITAIPPIGSQNPSWTLTCTQDDG